MENIKTLEVSSWEQAQEKLFADTWRADINRYRPSFAYRGLSDRSYKLPTSLIRLGRNPVGDGFDESHGSNLESHILRNFVKYAEDEDLSRRSFWYQLSVAQHHGLPTRLLDWTYSPMVALHFATENISKLDTDGVVWMVDIDEVHDKVSNEISGQKEGQVFTVDELSTIADSLPRFSTVMSEIGSGDQPVFFEPPSLDSRIVNQFALLSVHSDPTLYYDEYFANNPDLCKKVIIESSAKMEIRDKLDAANITERMLFPGLEGLADWLTRYYTQIGANETKPPENNGWRQILSLLK